VKEVPLTQSEEPTSVIFNDALEWSLASDFENLAMALAKALGVWNDGATGTGIAITRAANAEIRRRNDFIVKVWG